MRDYRDCLSVGVFLFLSITCSALPSPIFEQLRSNPNHGGSDVTDYSIMIREKRAPYSPAAMLILQTYRMLNTLLRGAKQLPSYTNVRVFQKPGSYNQALHDFSSVNPVGVFDFKMKNGVYGRIGQVGDNALMVRTSGNSGKATLEIVKPKDIKKSGRKTTLSAGRLTDKITYTSLH